MRMTNDTVVISWLPMYHDMGLIGAVLQPLYLGRPGVCMSPMSFLQSPLKWLRAISRYRGTVSGGPNFAYELCVRRVEAGADLTGLDLSSWVCAFNGAEPIRGETMARFADTFAPYGFQRSASFPCYGLAEATLIASGEHTDVPRLLRREGAVKGKPQSFVGCGRAVDGLRIAIVDPSTRSQVPEGAEGEIWLSGPSVAKGYWRREDATRDTFGATIAGESTPFLRTGDLGVLQGGELFVTGRSKDLIIIGGRNHYPQDIERTVEAAHRAIRQSAVAAFATEAGGEERIVVVAEARSIPEQERPSVFAAVRAAVARDHELSLHAIAFIATGSLPKTSSGKIQRSATRDAFHNGGLRVTSVWRSTDEQPIEAAAPQPAAAPATAAAAPVTAERLREWLIAELARRLSVRASSIDPHVPFANHGLDSRNAVELTGALAELLGRELPPTLLYEHPTVDGLSRFLLGGSREEAPRPPVDGGFEPMAIVGLASRVPGGPSAEQFWQLLVDRSDAVRELPKERWDAEAYYAAEPAPGKIVTRNAALVDDVAAFDASFFGITPREAMRMDPQHRILLESTWHALVDAGYAPFGLVGSKTGVFVGISSHDYAQRTMQSGDPSRIDAFSGTGNASSTAAGRISYLFGLQGPCMAIDTACSSSLVALHLAAQSLQARDCDLAIAGGVNVILSPESSIYLSTVGALSPDGRCKAFSDKADGYGRGEGCGLVVLKRLADAIADGDAILAVVRGSAVNQDGRSNGLTAPSVEAQKAVLRSALGRARLTAADVDYVEAHGTGTPLGDPIEAAALGEVLGRGRPESSPLLVGSVKANIAHLEAASGIAGVIKVVLALQHEELPAQLYADAPSRLIEWNKLGLSLVRTRTPWKRSSQRPRIAGVSSFGMSGTNAHVVLEEPPRPAASASRLPSRKLHALPLSAASDQALRALAGRFADVVGGSGEVSWSDLCASAARGRASLGHRLTVIADSGAEAASQLAGFRDGRTTSSWLAGQKRDDKPVIGFLFTGQGSQYAGMTHELFQSEPVFRDALERCDRAAREHLDVSLSMLLFDRGPEDKILDETIYTQPALFAVQYALSELWASWGIRPDVVLGYSVGEIAAACIAGAFDMEDGLRLACDRGRIIDQLCARGSMVAVEAEPALVAAACSLHADRVSVSGFNGPRSVTISGETAAVEQIAASLAAQGKKTRRLDTSHAFHSPLMAPALEPFARAARRVRYRKPPGKPTGEPTTTFISSAMGAIASPAQVATPAYWAMHLREPVRFTNAAEALRAAGVNVAVEIGPHPVLLGMDHKCRPGDAVLRQPSLVRGTDEADRMLRSVAALYVHGCDVRWSAVEPPATTRHVFLPEYPFARERHWLEDVSQRRSTPDVRSSTPKVSPRVPPRAIDSDAIVRTLRDIVGEVLGVPAAQVPVHTPLVEIGADSLVLIEGVTRIHNQLGVRVPLKEVFRNYPTIDALAGYIERALVAKEADGPQVAAPRPAGAATAAPSAASGEASVADHAARALTAPQRAHLDELQVRYQARTRESKRRCVAARPRLVDMRSAAGFRASFPTSVQAQWLHTKEIAYPIVGARSSGSRIWDVDGNEYIDCAMGFGVHLFGHGAPFLREAIEQQLEKGIQIGPQAEDAAEVAELVSELTGVERVAFCGSGTEAVMFAVRAARAVTGRPKIALFAGSYHGSADVTLGSIPLTLGSARVAEEDVLVLEYGHPSALEAVRAHAHELAAVLVEPIQGRRPELQPAEFLHELRAITREHAVALVFDEVLVGFRIHQAGAQAYFGVKADLVTYGKIVGGGIAIGVVAGDRAFLDVIDGGAFRYGDASTPTVDPIWFAGTFNKSPLSMAAARAALTHMKEQGPGLQDTLNRRTAAMAGELNAHFRDEGYPIEVVHAGSLFRFRVPRNAELFFHHLIHRGIYVWENRSCFLSTAHSDADVARIVEVAKASAAELRHATFLPPRPRLAAPRSSALRSGAALVSSGPPDAPMRLFCFPFAGGSTATFARWAELLRDKVTVCSVELPWHRAAAERPPSVEFDALASALAEDLEPHLGERFAFFGHSMGALLAYEIARKLEARGAAPEVLLLSGEPAPHLPTAWAKREHELDDDALVRELVMRGVLPDNVDRDLLSEALPVLRADLRICASYLFSKGPRLHCAIAAFCGASDPLASKEQVSAWAAHTRGDFSVRTLPGGHHFIRSARTVLLSHVAYHLHLAMVDAVTAHEALRSEGSPHRIPDSLLAHELWIPAEPSSIPADARRAADGIPSVP
jgi:acyl transferase domain-containing protein/surfactin synthase thioesterase subunit